MSSDSGWYPDPETGKKRYFDGNKWLDIPAPEDVVLEETEIVENDDPADIRNGISRPVQLLIALLVISLVGAGSMVIPKLIQSQKILKSETASAKATCVDVMNFTDDASLGNSDGYQGLKNLMITRDNEIAFYEPTKSGGWSGYTSDSYKTTDYSLFKDDKNAAIASALRTLQSAAWQDSSSRTIFKLLPNLETNDYLSAVRSFKDACSMAGF